MKSQTPFTRYMNELVIPTSSILEVQHLCSELKAILWKKVHFHNFLNKTLKLKQNKLKLYFEVAEKVFFRKRYGLMGV